MAVVTIAPVDIGSNPGFSGSLSGALSSRSGNTEKDEYALAVRVQYDQGSDYLTWGTVTYNYGESTGTKNEERAYAHIRHLQAIHENDWCGEVFVQTEQDEFKDINARTLVGTGVRWRFFNRDKIVRGYAGVGGFFEKIDHSHTSPNPNEENGRFNGYIAYTRTVMESSILSYVGYYQPKFDRSSDYITSQNVELIVPLYKNLKLSLSGKYLYDSLPALGVKKKDTHYRTAFVWEF
jgi:hypothetical protein